MVFKYKIKGKIYKIISSQTNSLYIGSTTQILEKRLYDHKCSYNSYLKGKGNYITSFEIVKYNDCQIILLQDYTCNTLKELHTKERYYIEKFQNCVNKIIPTRTRQEKKYFYDITHNNKYFGIKELCLYCGYSIHENHMEKHCETYNHKQNIIFINELLEIQE